MWKYLWSTTIGRPLLLLCVYNRPVIWLIIYKPTKLIKYIIMISFWWILNLSAVIQDVWIIYPYWVVVHSLAERCSPQRCFYFVGLQPAEVKTCQYEGSELCIRRRSWVIEIQHAIQIIPQVIHCCTQTLIQLNYHSGTLCGQWSNCC